MRHFIFAALLLGSFIYTSAQTVPISDSAALALASKSISAVTHGNPLHDVTFTGTANIMSATEGGGFTLSALGAGESRLDISLAAGTRSEIRDSQTGQLMGEWINPSGASSRFAQHNCWTDAAWFLPALGSLAMPAGTVLTYVGHEARNGEPVEHLQSYVYVGNATGNLNPEQLSVMDFYLDSTTLLPTATIFKIHPDNNSSQNILVEVDFLAYTSMNGFNIPTHIQRFQSGQLMLDLSISGATFNTGLPLSLFSIQ